MNNPKYKSGYRILAVNPGSTSTKIAFFEDETQRFSETAAHAVEALKAFQRISDQYDLRVRAVESFLARNGIVIPSLDAVVGRGGLLRPVEGGTYAVNDRMLQDLRKAVRGEHASNLGGLIARSLADKAGVAAYIVDPVVVDELEDVARISGLPQTPRRSIFHALNQKAVARAAALQLKQSYTEINLIVAHLGGGISVGCHRKGRVVDVNNALDGDGPFAPERAGTIPSGQLVDLCFSGRHSLSELKKMVTGCGGMVAHLGTNDLREVKERIATGDASARLVYDAMSYQIVKQIGASAAVLKGDVQAIVLTGGLAADPEFAGGIADRVRWIARVVTVPGEQEMTSLCQGALRVLRGQEPVKEY
jgi:butyrate kinase